jgi:hypothetical protein
VEISYQGRRRPRIAELVADQHHVESDAGGALGFLDSLGDRAAENEVDAEAGEMSVHVAFPR